eukprot:CAMPEP_0198118830 /NCGR_PEP_ID=MMETSP1442-20131203/23240_1 /TAXON_ID= /ORGANISM="Craspedostauros australis, Strain CCMP3328" /LENGTH=180 /DNA_ID=CAMNT_0043777155 /DNA_START=150 /DNA_END=693 /DNA_ORIENTATION=-
MSRTSAREGKEDGVMWYMLLLSEANTKGDPDQRTDHDTNNDENLFGAQIAPVSVLAVAVGTGSTSRGGVPPLPLFLPELDPPLPPDDDPFNSRRSKRKMTPPNISSSSSSSSSSSQSSLLSSSSQSSLLSTLGSGSTVLASALDIFPAVATVVFTTPTVVPSVSGDGVVSGSNVALRFVE